MSTRTLEINLRQGTGTFSEPMYGVVTIQRAKAKTTGGFEILPLETSLKLINGRATIESAETDGPGPFYDSVYLFRVQDGYCGRRYGFMAALPDGSTTITTGELPMVDPITGEGIYMDVQEWNKRYGELPNKVSGLEVRVETLEALGGLSPESPIDGQTANLIQQPNTLTNAALNGALGLGGTANSTLIGEIDRHMPTALNTNPTIQQVLDETYAALPSINATDRWIAQYGQRIKLPTHQPVSTDGQVVHPSVVYTPRGFAGYRYWMAYTPYEGGNDAYEDPCVVASNDGTNWELPAGIPFPLDDGPGGTRYNSDTNLVLVNGVLHCFWRYLDTSLSSNQEMIYVRKSSDGKSWSTKQLVHSSSIGELRILAPSFEYFDGKWHLWGVDINQPTRPLVYRTASELGGMWTAPRNCTIPVVDNYSPWHISIRRVGKQFVGLMNDTMLGGNGGRSANLFVISSTDGIRWDSSPNPVIPRIGPEHNDMYAATFVVTPDGMDIWYSAIARNPSSWHIFRTKATRNPLGSAFATLSGVVIADSVPANGGKSSVTVNFPPGVFSKNPIVTALSANGRCTLGLETTPTKDSVTINVFNWTPGGATSPRVHWQAIQQDA